MATKDDNDTMWFRHKADAEAKVESLREQGLKAWTSYSGACHKDENGEHYHPYFVIVHLTPTLAKKLGV